MESQAMDEALLQEVHRLKMALYKEESLHLDCRAENERLHAEVAELKSTLETFKIPLNEEIRSLKNKIINLTNDYETDKQSSDEKLVELETKLKNAEITEKPAFDEKEYEKVMNDLMNEKQLRVDLEQKYSSCQEEMCFMEQQHVLLEQKLKETEQHCEENREALEVKKENLAETLAALKAVQEEKALLTAEVDVLKAGPVALARGNSLFKEVEDNRKKIVKAYNDLKEKYLVIKDVISQKNQQINRLKAELSWLQSQDLGLDKILEKSNSTICGNLKKRIVELENQICMMQSTWKESPEIVTITENETEKLEWVTYMVNHAREETRKALANYHELSKEQVEKALWVRKTELEMMHMKSEMVQKNGQINKLETELANLKSELKENISQGKPNSEDSVLSSRNTNKTVRFADASLDETLCKETSK